MTAPAIEVVNLEKRFGAVAAVNGLSFQVAAGECVGILGPNGAGKTTTLEILEGLQEPTSGDVRVLGLRWSESDRELRARLGVQQQETRFYERYKVRETIRLYRSFYRNGLSEDEALALTRLEEKQNAYVMHLSGGQRQRLALAVALVGDPELLFLDEPTTGLDPNSRRLLWEVVEQLKQRGRTIVLTTHYMEEASRLCDRLMIVDKGKLIAEGSPAALISSLGGPQLIALQTEPQIDPSQLGAIPGVVSVHRHGDAVSLAVEDLARVLPLVTGVVQQQQARLVSLSTQEATLDDVFVSLTGRSLQEARR